MSQGSHAIARAALVMLLLPGFARGGEAFRLVFGYTRSVVENAYVEEGKSVFRTMLGSYADVAQAHLQVELIAFGDDLEMDASVRLKGIDVFAGSADQILKRGRSGAIEPALVAEAAGRVFEDAVLLVRKDAGILKFKPEYLAGIESLVGEHERLLRRHSPPARVQ